MENRRLIISEGFPELEGSLCIDAILEDGRKVYGSWFRSLVTRKYKFQVGFYNSLEGSEIRTYSFTSLSAMVRAFNSKRILTINSEGDIVL